MLLHFAQARNTAASRQAVQHALQHAQQRAKAAAATTAIPSSSSAAALALPTAPSPPPDASEMLDRPVRRLQQPLITLGAPVVTEQLPGVAPAVQPTILVDVPKLLRHEYDKRMLRKRRFRMQELEAQLKNGCVRGYRPV